MSPPIAMDDHYRTIADRIERAQKIERSEFRGIAFPIASDDAFFDELARIERAHFDATHHCWAFRLRDRSRSSDAGEPAGTAGRPILSAIEAADLRETGVVVVRWYGGVKLGTGGLSRAYRDTAALVLGGATVVDRFDYQVIRVSAPFDALNTLYRLVEPPNVMIDREEYSDRVDFDFRVRVSRIDAFLGLTRELRLITSTVGGTET